MKKSYFSLANKTAISTTPSSAVGCSAWLGHLCFDRSFGSLALVLESLNLFQRIEFQGKQVVASPLPS
ncbi:MAG: hypothetical protein ABI318_18430, partial [Chthoniobacteraceae bacterium]